MINSNTKSVRPAGERGIVLIVCLILLLMLSLIGLASLRSTDGEMKISGNELRSTEAFYAAESGLAFAERTLWTDYVNASMPLYNKAPGETSTLESYKYFLNSMGIYQDYEGSLIEGQTVSDASSIKEVVLERSDESDGVRLRITSLGGSIDGAEASVIQTIRVGAAPFAGIEYALLANNINCIMCHARIDNVGRYYNTEDSLRGSFDRVKVASLESMLLRTNSADSRIAGTLYTRGIVTDKSGNPISDLSNGGQCLTGYELDTNNGHIVESLNQVNLVNTTGSPLPQYGNLYLNYPTAENDMTDGILPGSFPPAIPDMNGNRFVDDDEFASYRSEANGTISGGILFGLNPNQGYSGSSLPVSGNMSSIDRDFDGNVILVGTASDPLVINGTIAIDGDVIIRGVVKGTGQIISRGNVYVAGDVTYSDGVVNGNRTFGVAADGTQNALALTAGGNIVVGDYLTPKGGNIADLGSMDTGDGSTDMSFTMSEVTLFNRMEWTRTQQFLPDINGNLVVNSTYSPGYTPRYYTLGPGDPVYVYNLSDGSGNGTYWDPASESWQGKEHISSYDPSMLTIYEPGDPEYSSASVINLAPQGGWVSETQLKQFWIADENTRTTGEPFKLDGLYYTNNALFTLTRSDKYNSKTWGQMIVNGSLVAADLGVLVPGSKNMPGAEVGLRLYYDNRLKQWVNVPDYSRVEYYIMGWASN